MIDMEMEEFHQVSQDSRNGTGSNGPNHPNPQPPTDGGTNKNNGGPSRTTDNRTVDEDGRLLVKVLKSHDDLRQEKEDLQNKYEELKEKFKTRENVLKYQDNIISGLEKDIKKLQSLLKMQTERSDEITAHMSLEMDKATVGKLQDSKMANLKVSKKFQAVFEEQWQELMSNHSSGVDEELKSIAKIAELVMDCYETCVKKHEESVNTIEKIIKLASCLEKECMKCKGQDNTQQGHGQDASQLIRQGRDTVLALFEEEGKGELAIAHIKEECWRHIDTNIADFGPFQKVDAGDVTNIKEFIGECSACFWKMVTSYPPLKLSFPAINQKLSDDDSPFFTKYSTQDDIIRDGLEVGTVVFVVWPAVLTSDGRCLEKGEVVTTDFTAGPPVQSTGADHDPKGLAVNIEGGGSQQTDAGIERQLENLNLNY